MLRFLFSAIAALLVLPILVGLLRRVSGGFPEDPPRGARGSRRGARGRGKATRAGAAGSIDRSAVIDVPYTEDRGQGAAERVESPGAGAERP